MTKLVMRYLRQGYGPKMALRLARNRIGESRATGAAIATKQMREKAQRGGAI